MEKVVYNPSEAVKELESWLAGSANYNTGVELFLKYGGDKGLAARTLKPLGPVGANKRLLKFKIGNMIADFKASIPATNQSVNPSTDQSLNPSDRQSQKTVDLPAVGLRKLYPNINLSEAPDEIKLMFAEAIASYGKMVTTSNELSDDMTEEERLAKLNELYLAREDNKAVHAELDYYNTTGKLLGEHPKLELAAYEQNMTALYKENPVKVQKERDKCYNNYARHKKQLDEGDFKNKAEKETYVRKWQAQMAICDKLLNSK